MELRKAEVVAKHYEIEHRQLSLPVYPGCELCGTEPLIPAEPGQIAPSYVPGRNLIMLAVAASHAEGAGCSAIFAGMSNSDHEGYPDCRPGFIAAVNLALLVGTSAGVHGPGLRIEAPLLAMTKTEVVREGLRLDAPISLTRSCYEDGERPCGVCDACRLRTLALREAGAEESLS